MGLWKAWKQVKAISATGTPTGQAPRGANNMAMGFAGAWMRMLGPLFASQAPERGSVLPGTEPDVAQPLTADALAAGIAAVRARDSAFDPELLTAFAGQVFSAVAGAWASGDASPVRDVVSDEMWEPLAAASHAPIAAGLSQLIGRETGRPALTGVWAGAWYDSALFHIDVTVDVPPEAVRDAPGLTAWDEEWLFQRSVTPGGSPSARPDHCPSCGAPTSIGPDGACTHCRAPVPVLTAGWLVTHVRSHNPLAAQMAGEASSLPPDLAQKLPPDVIAQVLRGGGPAGGSAR